ncbi:proline--tRNA ligase [Candidatus Woesearchaeota archaeon]|nr:proline--tRNA ligase [Candidatus Woesearchaeota archaeon]
MSKKVNEIGITVKKDEDFSEWFTQLMKKAELADVRYNLKGFPVYMPWAVRSIRKITRMWEEELEARGHEPLLMPLLIPESNFHKEADHVEGFTPEVFWVTHGGDKEFEERLALRPTSETALYDMYGKWIQTYRDLPFKRYQSVSVFRHETKMTRPFMRTREIHWTESHNVFATEEEAYKDAVENLEITEKLLYGKLAIPHIFFKRPQWDKFPGAINTFAADVLLDSGKVLQLPSSHMISQAFSKAFDVTYKDADEQEKLAWITCYGPAHSRNYGALITFHGDDKGLVLPWDVAPEHIVIVPLIFKGKEDVVLEKATEIKKQLVDAGYTVRLDDRDNFSPGYKFNEWEMKGMPIRIVVGPKDIENNQVELFRRDLGTKEFVPLSDLQKTVDSIRDSFTDNLRDKADKIIADKTVDGKTEREIIAALDSGKMIRTCFCSTDLDGEACATKVEKELGGEVRGEKFNTKEELFCDCPICGKKANHVVYIAKSH